MLRKHRSTTQQALADAMGCHVTMNCRYEAHTYVATGPTFARLATEADRRQYQNEP